MRIRTGMIVTGALMVALVIGGCSGGPGKGDDSTAVGSQPDRPVLTIPATFETEQSKQSFLVKAVHDGFYAEVKPLLQEVVADRPDANTYSLLGTSLYNLNEYDSAIAAWSQAAELNPDLAGAMHNNVGNALRDAQRVDEALNAYRKALEVEPTRWTAAVNMADILYTNRQTAEAVEVLESALVANQDHPSLLSLLETYKNKLD